jgi:RNA polymerase sigma-70 factor (ECF subfamily)
MKSKDELILKKFKNDEREAYKELFDLYYIPLAAYALKFCNSYTQAEDIVQDLFITLWDKKQYLNFDNQIKPYLFRSVKNNALKIKQREKNIYYSNIENQINLLYDEDYIDEKSLEDRKKKLFYEIEGLPKKGKEVFLGIVLHNRSYKEIADSMDISVNTVKTHYSRALKQLRSSLNTIILFLKFN